MERLIRAESQFPVRSAFLAADRVPPLRALYFLVPGDDSPTNSPAQKSVLKAAFICYNIRVVSDDLKVRFDSDRSHSSILQLTCRHLHVSILLLTAWVLLLGGAVYGTDYFVAPGGSDGGAGTIGDPFATITKAVDTASAGDTIYLRGGTHTYTTTITISKSGTSSAYYNLVAYPGDSARPLLDFSSMSENSSNRGIRLSGSYWYFEGIDIYKAGDNGMNVSGSNNIIEFCSFYENRDTGLQLGGGAANNQIINCDSYYNCDSGQGNADGFAPKLDVGTGNYLYGCRAWQNSDDGYDGYLRPSDGVTTTYENCWAFKNGYLKDGSESSGNSNGFKMGGSDDKTLRHDVLLTNCLSFDNLVKGFDQNNNKGSMTLYNCTGVNNGTYNYSIPSALASGETATITNCVSYGSSGVSLNADVNQTTDSWQGFTVTSADFVSIDPAAAYGARNADGSLPEITFMHLAAGSDLIDGGTNVGLPYEGSAPDLGAYEYTGGDSAPAAPSGLEATAGEGTVSLDWNDNSESDLDGYNVYRSTTSGSGYVKQNGSAIGDSNYVDSSVTNGTTYYYVVTAVDVNSNESDYSNEDSATPGDFTAPATPTGLTATGDDGIVWLDWNANSETDLAGYNIYRSTTSGSGYVKLNTAPLSSPEYDDSDVANATTYFYVVTAVDTSSNESYSSDEVSGTPTIYGDFIVNGTVDANDLGYLLALWLTDDCNATAGVDLDDDCIVNSYEFSAFANNWMIIPSDITAPTAPNDLSATAGDATVSLDWDDNPESDLAGYNVYRSTTSGSGYSKLNGSLLGISDYNDNGVSNGTIYYYVVTAVDTSDNESLYSNEDSATPVAPTTSITIQENETGFCGVDGTVDSDNSGFTGDGFANTDNGAGNGVDWRIEVLSSGTYTFTWRYANGATDRPANLLVDSVSEVTGISFPSTGNWTTWTTVSVQAALTTGIKDVRLEATGPQGLANIDYMQVTGPNLEAATCP